MGLVARLWGGEVRVGFYYGNLKEKTTYKA